MAWERPSEDIFQCAARRMCAEATGRRSSTYGCASTSFAVARFLGSTVSNFRTRSLADVEMLSHQGDGKSYLPGECQRRGVERK